MEILQLKYFCDAAISENFSATAKKFSVPSSNISQCIKRLEGELSVELFDRASNRIKLNDHGRVFYEYVSNALMLLDKAQAEIAPDKNSETIKICIMTNRRIVMNAIETFRHINPDTIIEISHGYQNEDVNFDIIIADDSFEQTDFDRELIVSEEIVLAIKNDNPLAKKEIITADELACQQFISMNKESSLYKIAKKICGEYGFDPNIVIHSEDPFYVRKCVELGLGIAFFPKRSWEGQFSENITVKSFGNFHRSTYAYWHNRKYLKKASKELLSILISQCEKQ